MSNNTVYLIKRRVFRGFDKRCDIELSPNYPINEFVYESISDAREDALEDMENTYKSSDGFEKVECGDIIGWDTTGVYGVFQHDPGYLKVVYEFVEVTVKHDSEEE